MSKEDTAFYRALLARTWGATGDRCFYCGKQGSDGFRTIDHVVPRTAGGADDEGNYVAACHRCNGAKSDRTVEGFREYQGRLAARWPHFRADQIEWLKANAILPSLRRYVFYGETIGLRLPGDGLPRGSKASETGAKGFQGVPLSD